MFTPLIGIEEVVDENVFWVHASSVGEVNASIPFLFELKNMFRESPIILSVFTSSGFKRAQALKNGIFNPIKFPLDNPLRVKELYEKLKPRALILIETELWPNLLYEAIKREIPIFMVNARISKKHWPRYKLIKKYLEPFMRHITLILAQNGKDAQRFMKLGVKRERIKIIGSLKYDILEPEKKYEKKELGFNDKDKIVVFGSLRSKEEDQILNVIEKLSGRAKFIIAPRHLIRVKFLKEKLKKRGIAFTLRSEGGNTLNKDVLIVDTLGELSSLYYLADIAFVGGTLAPYGGHSLVEPALASLPVLFGPHIFHTEDVGQSLIETGGGIMVKDEKELYAALLNLLESEEERIKMGKNARKLVMNNRGNAKKMVMEIALALQVLQEEKSYSQPG